MLLSENINLTETALLVIDAQDSFKVDEKRWQQRSNPAFEDNLSALIRAFQKADLPIYYFIHMDEDEGFNPSSPYFKLMDFVEAFRGDEPIIRKTTRNCFTSTNLQDDLRQVGIHRLIITGIQTEQCCETTARLAADLGYAVDFVLDSTATFPITNPDNPADVLDVDAIQERTVFALRNRFARIVTSKVIIEEITETL